MAHNVERAEAREITAEIKAAVEAVLAKRGMKLTVGMTHFGDSYDVKLVATKMAVDPETGIDLGSKEAVEWKRYAASFGLPAEGLGKTFKSGGHTFTVVGLNAKKYTRPVVATREDGKTFVFPPEPVKALLAVAGVR